ncbi:MAG: PDZ domain-containing protein [Spartobacteria bacterium]|nr:PDZ domain-containing protein [Spartobacteria bacterium]
MAFLGTYLFQVTVFALCYCSSLCFRTFLSSRAFRHLGNGDFDRHQCLSIHFSLSYPTFWLSTGSIYIWFHLFHYFSNLLTSPLCRVSRAICFGGLISLLLVTGCSKSLPDPSIAEYYGDDNNLIGVEISGKRLSRQEVEAYLPQFCGIGIDVTTNAIGFVVCRVHEGGPASRAGLKIGDVIVSVDDIPTYNLGLHDAIKLIRGEPNTEVLLSIQQASSDDKTNIVIIREPFRTISTDSNKD